MEGVPTNQLIVKMNSDTEAAPGSALRDMRQRLERAGEVLFLKSYTELHRTVVIFDSVEEAVTAKASLQEAGFEVQYGLGADRETVLNFHLAPPPEEKMFLLSPPPSPPEGWKPLYEGINSIPHFNMEVALNPGDNVLLEGDRGRGMPAITLDDWAHRSSDDKKTQQQDDGGEVFSMDE